MDDREITEYCERTERLSVFPLAVVLTSVIVSVLVALATHAVLGMLGG